MDKTFMHIVAIGIIIIAVVALIVCGLNASNDKMVVALVGIISAAVGALAGVLAAPKIYPLVQPAAQAATTQEEGK